MALSKEDVIANLRAIIISSKGGLKLSNIKADYYETFGKEVPLKDLGFSSLEEFFKNNSKDFNVVGNTVQAVTKNSSLHIVSLVNRQQTSKKKRRSKLFSKEARNIRQPLRFTNDPIIGKKSNQNSQAKSPRQSSNKESLTSALKQIQQMQQMVASKNNAQPNISSSSQTPDETKEERNFQAKAVCDMKEITRTVVNENVTNTKDTDRSSLKKTIKNESSKLKSLFDSFEDLHLTKVPLTVNLRNTPFKSPSACKNNNVILNENYGPNQPPSSSPFKRSLAKNSKEEILSARKTAQLNLDRNENIQKGQISPVDFTLNFEDVMKYESKLKQFCLEKGMILPVYSVIIREPINQPKCFGCKLSIGDSFHVSTYPIESHSEVAARELASKKAYNLLLMNNNLSSPIYEPEYVIKLRELCMKKNLPEPSFKTLECHLKNEPKFFICKVRIGDNMLLSSYPSQLQDEFSARDLAAKKAYDQLSSSSNSSPVKSQNDSKTLSKIYEMIKTKEYGVWSNKISDMYLNTYNEELTCNWFDLVKNSMKFEITNIEKAGHIIRAKNEEELRLESEEPAVLASLKVPESNHWEVYITNVVTSAEVWCRLIGKDYSEVYDTMMTKFELQPPVLNVSTPVIGEIYLVNIEESWNRVRVTEINLENEEVSVFLIDIGVSELVKKSQLFYLQKTFFSVPPQALLLSLNELDNLAECEELQSALFHSLLGGTFIAEVVAILDEGGNVCSVNLWDTSTEEDVNVNLKLLDDVIKTIKCPALPTIGLVKEMFVSHIEDNGDVYVQTSKQIIQFVDHIISTKMKNAAKLVPVRNKVDDKKLYVTRSFKSGLFYRAKILKSIDANTVNLKFIDYGFEEQAKLEDLFDLEETSLDLATIPSQIIRVKISNLKAVNNKILAKLKEHILNQNVLVKVITLSTGGLPCVELFMRSQSDGTLSSISNKVVTDQKVQVDEKRPRKKSFVVGLENTLSRNLPMPNIPPIGSYFNVYVTLAAHPGLFSVQPLATKSELMELMFRLQEKCESSFKTPLSQEDFIVGELYAVKYADDFWYRAYAHAIVSSSAFSVSLCDFGDFIMVPAEKLMPLSSEFKTFPYQAIRAYLAGIEPANKDWSAVDCVNFRELVIDKEFVSQVVEINRDAKNPNYITLGLILVDTSTKDDIYIHQLLLDRKMAILKKN